MLAFNWLCCVALADFDTAYQQCILSHIVYKPILRFCCFKCVLEARNLFDQSILVLLSMLVMTAAWMWSWCRMWSFALGSKHFFQICIYSGDGFQDRISTLILNFFNSYNYLYQLHTEGIAWLNRLICDCACTSFWNRFDNVFNDSNFLLSIACIAMVLKQ